MKRPFIQLSDNSIQFDNGTIMEFQDYTSSINGIPVTVQEWMEYLLSDQYKIDNGYDPED
jgi:hypothetical protein